MALSWPDRGLAGAPRCLRAVGIFLVIFVGSGGRGSSTDRYELASGLGHEAAIRAYIHGRLPRKGKKMVRTAVVTWRNTISPERRPEPPPDKRSFRPTYPNLFYHPRCFFLHSHRALPPLLTTSTTPATVPPAPARPGSPSTSAVHTPPRAASGTYDIGTLPVNLDLQRAYSGFHVSPSPRSPEQRLFSSYVHPFALPPPPRPPNVSHGEIPVLSA